MHFRRLSVLIMLLLCTLLVPGGLSGGQEIEQPAESEAPAAKPVAVKDVVDDRAIEERLSEILASRERYRDVTVEVENGVVHFDGVAQSDSDREWVAELAERTEGVVVVDNQISVDTTIDLEGNFGVVQESLMTLWRDFLKRMPLIVAACLVLVITALIAKLAANLTTRLLGRRHRIRPSLKDLLNQLTTIGIWVIGLTVAAVVVFPGMTAGKALTVLGLGSVAIGFAFKDIFENFFAGILILWRYPFDRGDFITCDGITGRVEEITVRNTLIRRLDGELTVVPNAHLFKSHVDVLNDRPMRRVRILCGVAYGEDLATAREVIANAVSGCESVKADQPVEVFANELADSSVNFEVAWWTDPAPGQIRASRDQVIEAIKGNLDGAGIEIPFPHRTLTFPETLEISRSGNRDAQDRQNAHNQASLRENQEVS